jgi:hypothetical protein
MAVGNRQDNARVTAEVQRADGSWLKLGVFEDRKGGASDSASVAYNLGAMGPRLALGGRQEPEAITITRLFDDEAAGYEKELRERAGKATVNITEVPLDDEGNAQPSGSRTWSGKLKKFHKLDYNAEANAAEQIELEVTVESVT